MAKLGEGDERWIVKERGDGKNCGGWHWSARARAPCAPIFALGHEVAHRAHRASRITCATAHAHARPAARREERDQTEWAKKRLRELLGGLVFLDDATGTCKVTAVNSINGEVTLQSRKQRRFAIYELDVRARARERAAHRARDPRKSRGSPPPDHRRLAAPRLPAPAAPQVTLKWEGQLFDAEGKTDVETKGTLRIEDLSEETLDGLPSEVTCDGTAGRRNELKELVRTKGAEAAKAVCLEFVKELKALVLEGHASDDAGEARAAAAQAPPAKPPPAARANNSYVSSESDGQAATAKLEVEYTFALNATFVYESLLDTNRMRAATAADASIEPREGGQLRLFNGAVEGSIVQLVRRRDSPRGCHRRRSPRAARAHAAASAPLGAQVPGEKIVQKWRFNTWAAGHFSDVTITLGMDGGNTKLKLVQTGVPVEERERTEKGWRVMIFDRLKMVLGGVPP